MSSADERTTVHHVSPLAELIERVRRQSADEGTPLPYAAIANRGIDLTRGEVQRYASKPLKGFLTLEKRRGLALGLRVHPIVVDRAVAQSLDLLIDPLPGDYRTDPELSASDRERIESYIRAIKEAKGQGRRNG